MNQYSEISIIVAEDHELFREGICNRIKQEKGFTLLGQAENGKALLSLLLELAPDIVIMDINMPEMNGIQATRELLKLYPDTKVIALTMYDNDDTILDMIEAGAQGYILKNADYHEIAEVTRKVHNGEKAYCKLINHKIIELLTKNRYRKYTQAAQSEITSLELDIIRMTCQSYSAKEIAEILKMNFRTIEGHKSRLLARFDVKNAAGLVVYAIKHKLVRIEDL